MIKVERSSWADLCRVIATFGVVIIHSSGPFFNQFNQISESDWLSAHFLNSLTRCSVPLFFMLSGSLLLHEKMQPNTLNQIFKRVFRIAIPLLVWSFFYLEYLSYHTGSSVDMLSVIKKPAMYHLTFVYTLIGVYLLLPILQVIFQLLVKRKDLQIYFFIFWFLVTSFPVVTTSSFMQSFMNFTYLGYFLIGGLVTSKIKNEIIITKWHLTIPIFIYIISIAITFFVTWKLSTDAGIPIQTAYNYFSPNVILASIAVFFVVSKIRMNVFYSKSLHWISERTFPIFFMHIVILDFVKIKIIPIDSTMPVLIQILFVSIVSFIVCLIISSILKFIPRSKYIFG